MNNFSPFYYKANQIIQQQQQQQQQQQYNTRQWIA